MNHRRSNDLAILNIESEIAKSIGFNGVIEWHRKILIYMYFSFAELNILMYIFKYYKNMYYLKYKICR